MDTNPVRPVSSSRPTRVVGPHRERPRGEDEPVFDEELGKHAEDEDSEKESETRKHKPAKGGESGSTIDVVG